MHKALRPRGGTSTPSTASGSNAIRVRASSEATPLTATQLSQCRVPFDQHIETSFAPRHVTVIPSTRHSNRSGVSGSRPIVNRPGFLGGSLPWKRGWNHGNRQASEELLDAALQPGEKDQAQARPRGLWLHGPEVGLFRRPPGRFRVSDRRRQGRPCPPQARCVGSQRQLG